MGKQVGPTPITAKLTKTTKGGIIQPKIKNLQVESPAKYVPYGIGASLSKRTASGAVQAAKHMADARKAGYTGIPAAVAGFAKGFFQSPKTSSTPSTPKAPQTTAPKKGTYEYAKSQNTNLDSIISRRNKAAKGSAEYNRYQNQINKAYGVGLTSRSTATKTTSAIKPASTSVSAKPAASTEIKPVSQTKKAPQVSAKSVKRVSKISDKSAKTRKKGEAALAAGDVQKAQRLRKKYDRQEKRASRKASRSLKRAQRK
jgi:hypothetical protein